MFDFMFLYMLKEGEVKNMHSIIACKHLLRS